jgi:DNA-3-methyladenine glycosylase
LAFKNMPERENMSEHLQLLTEKFYLQDSLTVAPALVGCVIETSKNGLVVSGRITETEAYPSYDAASHAFQGKRTPRTETQFGKGGSLYVYQIMGLHLMTSVVVGDEEVADVVFIRSIEPLTGIETMKERRGYSGNNLRRIASGPGMLSVALGVSKEDNGLSVYDETSAIRIYKDISFSGNIGSGTRINLGVHGVTDEEAKQATEHPWRFFDETSEFLSKS